MIDWITRLLTAKPRRNKKVIESASDTGKINWVGTWWGDAWRPRKSGTLMKLWETAYPNGWTTVGFTHMLNTEFNEGTPIATWYIGLINNSPSPTLSAADTMASHAGWVELTSYDEATRQEWAEDAAAGGVIASTTVAIFTISATVSLYGSFLTSVSTKGDNTGTLMATGALGNGVQPLEDDDIFRNLYSLTLTP